MRSFQRIQGKVDVEIRPVKVVLMRELNIKNITYPCILEPRVLFVREKILLPLYKEPEAVAVDIRHLNVGSACAKLG